MSDIHAVIRKTESALARCHASITSLSKLPITDARREWLASLERVVGELETELKRLRYAARHTKAAA